MPDSSPSAPAPDRSFDLALVLGGGNALGAYQAGAYQALHERGLEPDRVVGASAGAINGAVICGNPRDERLARLDALWTPARSGDGSASVSSPLEDTRRTGAAVWTLGAGQSKLFAPRNLFGPWWNPFASAEPPSLYDTVPLRRTLERLVDFDLLNRGAPHFAATAVDLETGDDVVMDSRRHRIEPDHIRASSALLPAFPPVEIGERLLGDAGISANLPLDCVLDEPPARALLCIAIDLLPLAAPRPRTLGDTVSRMQDLMFATQSRRSLAAWQAIHDERVRGGATASITVLHIAYRDQQREVSGKAFDFSPASAAARWRSGHADVVAALDALDAGEVRIGSPGLTVYGREGPGALQPLRWTLAPTALDADASDGASGTRE